MEPAGSARAAFEDKFRKDVATLLSITDKRIIVLSVTLSGTANTVTANITLDTDISTIKEGSDARKTFEAAFARDVAKAVGGIKSSRVKITSVRAASVLVEFQISPDSSGKAIAASAITGGFSSIGSDGPSPGCQNA